MTADMLDLACRAVASPRWEWRAGMLTSHGARCLGRDLWVDRGQRVAVFADPNEGEVPDLTDAATIGCLLALVREAWGDPHASASWDYETNGQVVVACSRTSRWIFRDRQTEAEALVAALEAAP